MKIYKLTSTVLLEQDNQFYSLPNKNWDELVNQDNLHQFLQATIKNATSISGEEGANLVQNELLSPIGQQEV